MPKEVKQFDILISCPSDVKTERQIIAEIIDAFNRDVGEKHSIRIQTRHWSTDSFPELHSTPQEILNNQFVKNCDFTIAIFWTRLGTSTNDFESGTVEEIENMIASGKDVFLYFSDCPSQPSSISLEQYGKVKEFKSKCKNRGLYYEYSSLDDFKIKLSHNILKYMERFYPKIDINRKISVDELFVERTGFSEKIRLAKSSLFISGVSMVSILSSSEIEKLLAVGVKVRLLLTRNTEDLIREQAKLSYTDIETLANHKNESLKYMKKFYINKSYSNLEIREIDAVVPMAFVGIDLEVSSAQLYVQSYMYLTHPAQSPNFMCSSSEIWFERFRNQIELLWDHATEIDFSGISLVSF